MAFPEMIEMDYKDIGKTRFIGAAALFTGGDAWDPEIWVRQWKEADAYRDTLSNLLGQYGIESLKYPCSLVYTDNEKLEEAKVYYIAGHFFRQDTPVPEGLQYCDIDNYGRICPFP